MAKTELTYSTVPFKDREDDDFRNGPIFGNECESGFEESRLTMKCDIWSFM